MTHRSFSSDITFSAEVVCGRPGCPWKITVEGHHQGDAQSALEAALKEHKESHNAR